MIYHNQQLGCRMQIQHRMHHLLLLGHLNHLYHCRNHSSHSKKQIMLNHLLAQLLMSRKKLSHQMTLVRFLIDHQLFDYHELLKLLYQMVILACDIEALHMNLRHLGKRYLRLNQCQKLLYMQIFNVPMSFIPNVTEVSSFNAAPCCVLEGEVAVSPVVVGSNAIE